MQKQTRKQMDKKQGDPGGGESPISKIGRVIPALADAAGVAHAAA